MHSSRGVSAIPWAVAAAAVAAGGAIIAGSEAQSGANSAANAALSEQQTQIAQEAPYTALGQAAIPALENGLGIGTPGSPGFGSLVTPPSFADYKESPGYQFQLNQGMDAITNSAAATGGVRGGNTLKALQAYGTGLANQDYQQFVNNTLAEQQQKYGMLANTVNTGANAAANVGSGAIQTGANLGNIYTSAGNTAASTTAAATNAASSGINNYLQLQYLAANNPNQYPAINNFQPGYLSGDPNAGYTYTGTVF